MALQIEVGHFTQPGGTGDQTVNLVDSSLTPVAIILWCTPVASAGIVAHASMCLSFGTRRGGATQQVYIMGFAEDNIGTADTYRDMGTDRIISLCDATGVTDAAATLVSFGAGQFTVNWNNLHTTASITVSYMVFGGDDVLDAEAHGLSYTAATGAEDMALGSGFGHPDVVFFARTARTFAGNEDAEAAFSFGWGVRSGSNNGRGIHWTSDDAATTEAVLQRINNNIALQSGAAATIESAWTLAAESGWPTDGYEINKTVASFAENFIGLAIRFSSDVVITTGEVAAQTTNGTTRTLTSSDTPRGCLLAHVRTATANTSDTTSADCGLVGVGAIDDANHEQWRGMWDDDGQGTASVASSAWTDTKAYRSYTPNNDTLIGEADGAVNGSNFELSFNDGDSIASLIEYIAFSEIVAATGGPVFHRRDRDLPLQVML